MTYERIYYVTDCGELTCEECTGQDLVDHATYGDTWDGHGPRRWRAAVRLASMAGGTVTPSAVERILRDDAGYSRDTKELRYHYDLVADVTDSADSANGEYCGGCSKELQAPWATCELCQRDDFLGDGHIRDPFVITYTGDSGDGFRVVCAGCWDDWRDLLASVGFVLSDDETTMVEQSLDANGPWQSSADGTWHRVTPFNLRPDGYVRLGIIVGAVKRHRWHRQYPAVLFPADAA